MAAIEIIAATAVEKVQLAGGLFLEMILSRLHRGAAFITFASS